MAAADQAEPDYVVRLMASDIRDATSRQMLPAAGLAAELVRRGWRPVVDNAAYFMGAGDVTPDHSGERGPAPGGAR